MLYIFGDSHADFSFRGLKMPHQQFHRVSHTMHRVGRDNIIPNLETHMISTENIFVLTFGEVDCRCHIGKQVRNGRDIMEVCETLISSYIQTIKNNITAYDRIIICSITPPANKEKYEALHGPITHEFPFVGSDQERVENTRIMNSLLKLECEKNNYTFLDSSEHYSDKDGCLIFEKSDACVHIGDNEYVLETLTNLLG